MLDTISNKMTKYLQLLSKLPLPYSSWYVFLENQISQYGSTYLLRKVGAIRFFHQFCPVKGKQGKNVKNVLDYNHVNEVSSSLSAFFFFFPFYSKLTCLLLHNIQWQCKHSNPAFQPKALDSVQGRIYSKKIRQKTRISRTYLLYPCFLKFNNVRVLDSRN